jgi:poly-gamma-glutamate synthase PgsB/CapB
MWLVLLLALAFFTYGAVEYRLHVRRLRNLPIRIHVNGTRGKSSVTRLIAAGLREGGVRTVAKTTGSAARYIDAEGDEEPVPRPGPANIREQIGIVSRAVAEGTKALVLECMAIRPDLQKVCENQLVRSTVGVITNVRPDHLDVMGPTVEDVAVALSGTIPRGGVVFTSERDRVGPLSDRARELGADLRVVATPDDRTLVEGFGYVEHAENVALSLAVCEHLGVERGTALRGMRKASPDPGALTIHRFRSGDKDIEFVNAFAANDRESTKAVWDAIAPRSDPDRTVIAVVGMREDRPDRAFQFGEILAEDLDADHYILAGGMTQPVRRIAVAKGVDPATITDLGGLGARDVFEALIGHAGKRTVAVGVGNIGGVGGQLLRLIQGENL